MADDRCPQIRRRTRAKSGGSVSGTEIVIGCCPPAPATTMRNAYSCPLIELPLPRFGIDPAPRSWARPPPCSRRSGSRSSRKSCGGTEKVHAIQANVGNTWPRRRSREWWGRQRRAGSARPATRARGPGDSSRRAKQVVLARLGARGSRLHVRRLLARCRGSASSAASKSSPRRTRLASTRGMRSRPKPRGAGWSGTGFSHRVGSSITPRPSPAGAPTSPPERRSTHTAAPRRARLGGDAGRELDRTLVRLDVDHPPARDQVTGLGMRAVDAPSVACARPNGLPSESRQIAHSSPGWTTVPPCAVTRSSAAGRSSTVK
jgi:hypothetical protein